jgi:hypothetical protein
MNLANIETPEENKCILYVIEKGRKYFNVTSRSNYKLFTTEQSATLFWQALNKIGLRNYTQWLNGKALSYDNWNTGEPAAFATENCAAIE